MKLQTKGMKIITKSRTLYSSSPGDPAKATISVQNDYDAQIVDVFWGMGTYTPDTGGFSIVAYLVEEQYNFPALSSYQWESGAFYTPDVPGTWDLIGILADDIYFDESGRLVVVGQHGSGFVEQNGWTISVAAELAILGVGVQGA